MSSNRTGVAALLLILLLGTAGALWLARHGQRLERLERSDGQPARESAEAPPPAAMTDIEPRLLALEAEVAALRRRIGRGAQPGEPAGAERPSAEGGLPADTRQAVLEVLGADESPVREQVRRAVSEQWEELREERRSRRQAHMEERARGRLERAMRDAPLSDAQTESVLLDLRVERERIGELFRSGMHSEGFDEVRRRIGELRAETDEGMESVLSPEQVGRYRKMREEEDARFRRGHGGPPPP